MSTIAYRNGVIASDSQITLCDEKSYGVEKVGRTENFLFGFSGRYHFIRPMFLWISELDSKNIHPENFYKFADQLPDFPSDSGSDSVVLLADRAGDIFLINSDGFGGKVFRDFEAIGSGAPYALGGMACGVSAIDAVLGACELDVYSGGCVVSWDFNKPVHCPNDY